MSAGRPAAAPLLEAEGIGLRLGGRAVLDGVTLALAPGWTAIVGRNGAGKSTLLRVLAGLAEPEAGRVLLAGRPLAGWAPRERGQRIAWLAQQGSADGDAHGELTVREVVALGRLPHLGLLGAPSAADDAVVAAAMAATECGAWPGRRLCELSGGERQRVLIARVLAVEAPVLLLDEPTAHLDPPHQAALARLFATLGRTHAVASVVHDLTLALRADRVVVMDASRIAADGARDDRAMHAALEAVFDGAIRVERIGAQWHALPQLA